VHNMLDVSMVCFPYVVIGVGQAVIAGTHMTKRKTENTDELQGRRVTRLAVETATSCANVKTIPRHPVLSPQWGKVSQYH